ncbi:MAG: hypothetical protein HYZ61_01915 [Candidatus Andersenbacteria bacterium]|nr:hypothetical protein [Candidatus Andersenbacteria bacterium]
MWQNARQLLMKDRSAQVALFLFVVLSIWWVVLQIIGFEETSEFRNLIWAASYQIIAFLGGILGLLIARSWGGLRSIMGRSIGAFALGLLLQTFGQSTFSFYNLILNVDIPYPSLADLGFFGSIPLYIYGIAVLARASGVTVSLRSFKNKIQALLIPLAMLIFSYIFFLRNYEFDWSSPFRIFFDFGYPLGQAVYVSIAILTYLLSKKALGGVMRPRIFFILAALVVQYLADYNFLYQTINETWQNGGYGDYIYLLAYLLMALGLFQLKMRYIEAEDSVK